MASRLATVLHVEVEDLLSHDALVGGELGDVAGVLATPAMANTCSAGGLRPARGIDQARLT